MTAALNAAPKKKSISITTQILLATGGGVAFGGIVGPWGGNLKFIGDIFIRLIQMSVVILVMSAIIGSIGSLKGSGLGRMGFNTVKWFILFTLFAACLGLGLAEVVQPGAGIQVADPSQIIAPPPASSIQETILGFFPTNILGSMAQGAMIPCIVFSLVIGLAISKFAANNPKSTILSTITDLNGVVLNIIQMIMKIAPIGIFCLLANVSGAIGFRVIVPMIKYLGVLAVGDVILLAVYFAFAAMRCKINPFALPGKFAKMSLVAITTTSSAITLPTKLEDSVTKFGISRRVSDFVGPLAMTMNSSGAALCYVVMALFLAQTAGITMTTHQIVMSVVLSCLMCMGTISVPGGSVVVCTFLASSLGLPPDSIALMLGVDWFAGMFRTLLNVDADVIVAMLVANAEGELDRDVYNGKKEVAYT